MVPDFSESILDYVEGTSPKMIRERMLKLNVSRERFIHVVNVVKDGPRWYCWFYSKKKELMQDLALEKVGDRPVKKQKKKVLKKAS